MTYTIHKGNHRPRWWFFRLWPWFGYKVKSVSRKVCFAQNCWYQFKPPFGRERHPDQDDVNKLFGIGYMWNRKNSARFGWNYNIATENINLFAYYHFNGNVEFTKICEVSIGINYLMILNIHSESYSFSVVNMVDGSAEQPIDIRKRHDKEFSYNLGPYFGGNQKAPRDITIEINKL